MGAVTGWIRYLPFLFGCTAIWWVSSMPKPPVPEALVFDHSDKLMHAAAYAVLAALAFFGARGRWDDVGHAALEAWVAATVYGVVDEVHQSFTPGRSSTVSDAIADTLGAGIAMALVARAARSSRARAAQAS